MEKIFFLIIGCLILITLFQFKGKLVSETYCLQDPDCVPATCCHPDACVNKNYAPNCTGVVCSLECKPRTMDCAQGYCACINNKCKAIIE